MSYVCHICVIVCCLLVYIHVLFLFWLVIVIVSNFEVEFCFGFKVGYVEVFGCCFVGLFHFVSIVLTLVKISTHESCFVVLRFCF